MKIKINPGPKVREQYVANIITVFQSASEEQEQAGRSWYPTAHRIADMMTDGDVETGAGLLAALSPQTSWNENVRLACDAYDTGRPAGHFGDALSKATRILAGLPPESVLPMQRKTGHFYRCIVDPADKDAVCVDRHAHDVDRPLRRVLASAPISCSNEFVLKPTSAGAEPVMASGQCMHRQAGPYTSV